MIKNWIINTNPPYSHDILSDILKSRNIKDIQHFLNPVEFDLIDPFELKNMKKSVDIILNGIKEQKRFGVFYDAADCDGLCAGQIMRSYLLNYISYIEIFFLEGKQHGIDHLNLDDVISKVDILIIVDSSSDNFKEQQYLKDNGVEVIIYDHHPSEEKDIVTVVNCKHGSYLNPELSGGAVTWKACMAIDITTGQEYSIETQDLAGISILADVCNIGEDYPENRYIVKQALGNLENPAIRTIIGKYDFTSTSVLFSIAPIINAAARTSNNKLVIDFLNESNPVRLAEYLRILKEFKEKQDESVENSTNNLEFQIRSLDLKKSKVIYGFTDSNEFAGLIGSKLCNKYNRPAIILHEPKDGDDEYKGSMRGYGVDDFKAIIHKSGKARCFGHVNAAGIRIKVSDFDELIKRLNNLLKDTEFIVKEEADVILKPSDITPKLIEKITEVNKISGHGFKPIAVVIENLEPDGCVLMQNKHSKFVVEGIECIKWNDSNLAKELQPEEDCSVSVDVLGTLQLSNFAGKKSKQIIIQDYKVKQELDFLKGLED